jgi:hypothetical protein
VGLFYTAREKDFASEQNPGHKFMNFRV